MRIGSIIAILLLVLIGSGYLLSDNLHTREDLNTVKQQLSQAIKEKNTIQEQLTSASSKIVELNQQMEQLSAQVNSLQGQVRLFQDENQTLKNQNAQLQERISRQTSLASLTDYLAGALPSPLSLAIFLPAIPISMVAMYVMVRSKKQNDWHKNQTEQHANRKLWAQLTEEEMKHLIKMRRGR